MRLASDGAGPRALIARRGIDDTTIADITEAADVAVGSFYTHFVSKEQLVDGLVAEAIEAHGLLFMLGVPAADAGRIASAPLRTPCDIPDRRSEVSR